MILKGFEALQSFLEKPKNIVVIGHRNPDGDAMGSTLALAQYLTKKGHTATVVVPNEYPNTCRQPHRVVGDDLSSQNRLDRLPTFFACLNPHDARH